MEKIDISFPVTLKGVSFKNKSEENYQNLSLKTDADTVETRYYSADGAKKALVLIGGVGGGFDTPAKSLFPKLASELMKFEISSLRIQYRDPHNIEKSVFDVLTGLSFLHSRNINEIGIVGHSFGGAVAVRAAIIDKNVSTVVTLAAQSYGAGQVADLSPRCSILLIHGSKDNILPLSSSEHIFELAGEPKKIVKYTAGHLLDENAESVYADIKEWLLGWLKKS